MQFRIYGLLLIGLGVAMIWYLKPRHDGTLRYPQSFQRYLNPLAIFVTFLIGMGLPMLFFGAPDQGILSEGQ
jgi:hypothetical protein